MENNILKIKMFHDQVRKLKDHKDFFVNLSLKINYRKIEGYEIFFKKPDDKTIKAFLMDFRPFYLQYEEINFFKICNILELYLTKNNNTQLRQKVRETRSSWNKLLERKRPSNSGGFRYVMHGKKYKDEEIMDLWMNGKYFHPTDKKKQKYMELKQFCFSPLEQMAFMSFLDLVQKMAQLIFWLDKNVVDLIMTEYDE